VGEDLARPIQVPGALLGDPVAVDAHRDHRAGAYPSVRARPRC
jgi:hypothetical protein